MAILVLRTLGTMKVYLQNRVHFLALTVHIENILPQVMFIDKFNEVFSQNLKNVGIVCVFFINDFFFFIFFFKSNFSFQIFPILYFYYPSPFWDHSLKRIFHTPFVHFWEGLSPLNKREWGEGAGNSVVIFYLVVLMMLNISHAG